MEYPKYKCPKCGNNMEITGFESNEDGSTMSNLQDGRVQYNQVIMSIVNYHCNCCDSVFITKQKNVYKNIFNQHI